MPYFTLDQKEADVARILVTGDNHAGVPRKLSYSVWGLRVIRAYALKHDIKHVVILGDLFHDRVNINIEVLNAVYGFFEEASSRQLEWLVFPGNHDMFMKNSWDIHSLKPLTSLINVIPDVRKVEIAGAPFWVIPFIYSEESYMKILETVEKRADKKDVLLTHIGVNGAKLNECFLIKNWSFVTFDKSKFDVILAGHFHCHQQIGNLHYPGSPTAFRFDEGLVPHGFLVYDTDSRKVEFVEALGAAKESGFLETAPPSYLTTLDEDLNGRPPEYYRGNNIRIILTKDYTLDELTKLANGVRERGAASVNWLRPKEKDADVDDVARKTEVDMKSPDALLDKWLESDKPQGLDRKLLAKLNKKIVAEAEERISVEMSDD
jgi:DNA repair exonuclease SbcCD nuclease subunit